MAIKHQFVISASKAIAASPGLVYSIIADYREGHPSILPPQFTNMTVEQGGTGVGTIIRFSMRFLGKTQHFRGAISEPEPGRVLTETYLETNGAVTSFIVDPGPALGQSRVTVTTSLNVRGGFLGKIERLLSTRILHPIYLHELELLALRATSGKRASSAV
jgi:hypothetical protein